MIRVYFVGSLFLNIVSYVNIQLKPTCPELTQYLMLRFWGFSTDFTVCPPPDCTVASLFITAVCKQDSCFALAHLTCPWNVLWKNRALKRWNMCQVTLLLPWLSCPDLWGPCRNHCRSFRTLSSALWWGPGSPNPPVSDLSWACHSLQRRHTKSHRLINQPER